MTQVPGALPLSLKVISAAGQARALCIALHKVDVVITDMKVGQESLRNSRSENPCGHPEVKAAREGTRINYALYTRVERGGHSKDTRRAHPNCDYTGLGK
jgi:hypothetical protein